MIEILISVSKFGYLNQNLGVYCQEFEEFEFIRSKFVKMLVFNVQIWVF